MLELAGRDLQSARERRNLCLELDTYLKSVNTTGKAIEDFFIEATSSACIDPNIGVYVELFGIDQLCVYRGLTPEQIEARKNSGLTARDLELLNEKLEKHLTECPNCIATSMEYIEFIDDVMPIVEDLVGDFAETITSATSIPEVNVILQKCIDRVCLAMITPERMRAKHAFDEDILSVPCESPKLWRYITKHGLLYFTDLLVMSDAQLKRAGVRMQMSYAKRMRVLHEVSEHVKICLRCSCVLDYERIEHKHRTDLLEDMLRHPP